MTGIDGPLVEKLRIASYRIPTETPESDGTLSWDSTGLIVVEIEAGGCTGLGYTYAHPCAAMLIQESFAEYIVGHSSMDIPAIYWPLIASVRNLGRPGVASMAISAVDIALWDLKARLLDIPLAKLIGQVRPGVPAYASGGFTSYSLQQLCEQVDGWATQDFAAIKIKLARHQDQDNERLRNVRRVIGPDIELFVDANGGYSRKQALAWAEELRDYDVTWLEEPVSSDDLKGLRLLRDRSPGGMDICAGEYGHDLIYFQRMLGSGAVDVLQADATRCGGISGFLAAGMLCEAHQMPLSSHTAPAVHLHAACGLHSLRHMEWFYDHVRIEALLFDGVVMPRAGMLSPDLARPGHGLTFKHQDAERYAA